MCEKLHREPTIDPVSTARDGGSAGRLIRGVPGGGVLLAIAMLILAVTTDALATPAQGRGRDRGRPGEQRQIRFAGMDANRDGVITRAEWRGSDRSFEVHDWNGDNVLSGDEVRVGARRARGDEPPGDFDGYDREYIFTNWTPAGFTALDHDRDGRITRSEWHYQLDGFHRADHNGDGALSRSEFLGGDDRDDDDRDDSFQDLDMNGDGRVSLEEWHGTRARFNALDRDRNGVLTRVEFAGTAEPPPDLFASLDVNGNGQLSWDEWHWSREAFDARDANRDGVISRDEVNRTGGVTPDQHDVHRGGFERGLADGRTAGRRDREQGNGWFLEGRPELERADAGFQGAADTREMYRAGYRDGFRRGYREGYAR